MSASRHPALRLQHIRDEIASLRVALAEVSFDEFVSSYLFRRSTEHALLIISEAVRALPIGLTDQYPGPDWANIRVIGNILRHEYFAIDAPILWNTTTCDLPQLALVVDRMIADLDTR